MQSTTLAGMLAAAVSTHPDRIFLRSLAGELSYADFAMQVASASARLARAGVSDGEVVGLLMGNGLDQVAIWFAVSGNGFLHVPLNTGLVGDQLIYVLETAQITTLVVDRMFLPQVTQVLAEVSCVQRVLVRGELEPISAEQTRVIAGHVSVQSWDGLGDAESTPAPTASRAVADVDDLTTATLLFTSGSTGRSKACALSHRYMTSQGQLHAKYLAIRSDDVLYTPFPLFHIDGANLTVVAALAAGCTAALGERFSASRFWSEVRALDATIFNFMGATLTILFRRSPSDQDRRHRVRLAWGVPMPDWFREWVPRFGFQLVELYGSTDAGVPAYDPVGEPHQQGSCGRIIDEYEVITVDEHGARNDPDQVGEIWVRGRRPGLVMNGYHRMPEESAKALHREGWVRTGDAGWISTDGRLHFHSRLSDTIRRRGENISALEVERLVQAHPLVSECAAIGVQSDLTEEEVKVFVLPQRGSSLTSKELITFCRATMPSFMVPRYIELVDDLPRTPTEKTDKPALRRRPLDDDADDFEARRPTKAQPATEETHP